ncbi:MAG: CHASE2 domain-containing protein, partial [Candidatus Zixiibacteriota bacterium]
MSNRARFIFYLALTLIVIGVKFLDIEELDQFELRFQDMVYDFKQAGEPSEDVVIVTIDKLSLEQIGSWPWPEETIADLVAAIGTADPRTTMIDFPIPVMDHRGASDTAKAGALMAQQLKLMNNVTLVYDIVPSERASDTVINPKYLFRNALVTNTDLGVLSEEQAIPVKAVALPDEKLADAAARLGFNYTQTDPDMVLRSDPLIMNFDGYYYPSAPLAAAGHYLKWQPENLLIYGGKSIKAPDREIPTDRHGRMLLNYPVGGGFNLISATDVLHQRVDFAEFKNKLVMVALATGSQMEYYRSPVTNETPSYIKSAVAIDNIISKEYLMRADSVLGWYVLALFFIGVIFAFGLPLISSLYRVIVVALGLIVLANVNYFMFNSFNMLANSIYVALLLILFLVASPLTTLDYSFLTALFRRKSEEEGDNGEVEGAKAKSRARRQPGADDGEEWTRMPAGQSANATANETMNATVALTSAVQAQSDLSQTNATAALGESAGNAGTPAFKHSESARKVHKHDITGQGAIVDPPAPPPAPTADPDKTAVGMGAEGFGDISGADLDTPLVDTPAIEETSAISPDEVNIP